MKYCKIIEDLYPVYSEGSCSAETKEFVEHHIAECEQCRKLFAEFPSLPKESVHIPETVPFKKIQNNIRMGKIIRNVSVGAVCVLIAAIYLICKHIGYPQIVHSIRLVRITAFSALIASFILMIRAIIQTVLVICKKERTGSALFLWAADAAMFILAVIAFIIDSWG